MYFTKPPYLFRKIFKKIIYNFPTKEKTLYLTFDDGPIPGVTTRVLDTLLLYKAKATFFCLGKNVKQNPEIYRRIIEEGHAVGNHTYNHLDGWKTKTSDYLNDIEKCAALVKSPLFRPPYGRLLPQQYNIISKKYIVVLWDVLSGDFDKKCNDKLCLKNVITNAQNGSVIVFHDSHKAKKNMLYALSATLEKFQDLDYVFKPMSYSNL